MTLRALIVLLGCACALRANSFEAVREALRDSIRTQLTASGTPSLAVAVAKDGRIIWEEGFGWADRARRIPASEHTMYSLASISKPFTATALMTLVEAGKIDLDRPINEYLGTAKIRARVGDAAEATVRRVANHSSGLPLHYQFFYADEPARPPSMDETILRYGNLVSAPGEKYRYSNLGFGILGYLISRVSGQSYEDFMREQVFLKLGLTHSSVGIEPALKRYQAIRYDEAGRPIPFYDFDHRAASAVYASAHDLVRFGMFHLKDHLGDQHAILPDASLDAMHEPTMPNGNRSGYGIGWVIADREDGYRLISHTGSMPGVATTLMLVPSENLAVAVLCNAAVMLPHQIGHAILAAMLPKWRPEEATPVKRTRFQPSAELIGEWTGKLETYKTEIPLDLHIFPSGDIHARLGKQMEMLWNDTSWHDGYLTGRMPGDIGTEDAARHHYHLQFDLKLRGAVLNGSASAISDDGGRTGGAQTQWVELKKR